MNILFLLRSIGLGGVEVVSVTLANKFAQEGHTVSIFAREKREKNIKDRLDRRIHVYEGVGDNGGRENVALLHNVYIRENIQVVINQWGLPYMPIRLARKAEQGHRVKIISFHHNDPCANGKLQIVSDALASCKNPITKILLKIKYNLFRIVTSKSMLYTYRNSDKFMVLSNSYIANLHKFIGVGYEDKQGVLTNPITIDCSDFKYSFEKKQKEIIYCGRVDYNQKRVYRLIDAWSLIEEDFLDWKLTIIGDGGSRKDVEIQAFKLGLKNIQFEGFQKPHEYYKRASILVLTSEYEGFPLVLAECMSYGVVPVVYDSFSAVHDIINDEENGLVVPKVDGGFSKETFAERLRKVMVDDDTRNKMAQSAIETSKEYSLDTIYEQWKKIFESLK